MVHNRMCFTMRMLMVTSTEKHHKPWVTVVTSQSTFRIPLGDMTTQTPILNPLVNLLRGDATYLVLFEIGGKFLKSLNLMFNNVNLNEANPFPFIKTSYAIYDCSELVSIIKMSSQREQHLILVPYSEAQPSYEAVSFR